MKLKSLNFLDIIRSTYSSPVDKARRIGMSFASSIELQPWCRKCITTTARYKKHDKCYANSSSHY